MESEKQYYQENAMMFARLEELAGKVDGRIAKVRTYEQKIIGLEFELKKTKEERDELKSRLAFMKKQQATEKQIPNELEGLSAESFTIRNKIAKIVTDIERREVGEEGIRELIQTLIGEIDDCISLLK
ncbi:hypothetical protein [Arcticibacterium luteifluviistationis]|uniref:Uncharacterized protein n=1 Tax=Arcticibacterium luteifluviistationis TaxID=1784714 RepID=A0A2Z4G8N1_9BACT|nr:hypothetical protein [Arcticibacterium luteifluviistationis]AWV97572.1 hypothetical protein DJ013_05085 [Arcticibacterium luteifluviistationis]